RREHFISSRQERDQTHWVEAAFSNDGKIVGLKNFFLYDTGAYSTSLVVPWITLATIPGPYKVPNLQLEFKAVYTNKVTAMVVRGSASASRRMSKARASAPTRAAASRSAPTARFTFSPARHRRDKDKRRPSVRSAPTISASISKTSTSLPATARRFLTASELS